MIDMALDVEIREAIHQLREELGQKFAALETEQHRISDDRQRLVVLERLFAEHVNVCTSQMAARETDAATMKEVKMLLESLAASKKVANMARSTTIWISTFLAAIIIVWKAFTYKLGG